MKVKQNLNERLQKLYLIASLAIGLVGSFSCASADVIKPGASHFTKIGRKASFAWAPANYSDAAHPNNPFFYDIFYYIPRHLKHRDQVNALIFNHGGGDTTVTRDGSIAAVNLYINDLIKLADEQGCIVVLPSANGLNWGGHTVGIMTALSKLMRQELSIDPQHLGLSGHSMGGMGITRAYSQLADQFAFFLPQASGMDLSYATDDVTEWQLNKVFNVAYTQLQGTHDKFDVFVTRGQDQLRRTELLESTYLIPSKLQVIFYNTDHDYKFETFRYFLEQSFLTTRDLYQTDLYGTYGTGSDWRIENNIPFPYTPSPRYFWVEAVPNDVSLPVERTNFHARIVDNNVVMEYPKLPSRSNQIKVYLHSKMVDFTKPVKVLIDGQLMATRPPGIQGTYLRSMDPTDPTFLYEDQLTVNLPTVASPVVYPTPSPTPIPTPSPAPSPVGTPFP